MKERIARAICRQHNLDEGYSETLVDDPIFRELDTNWLKCADAVLAAMREPTEAMLDAGHRYHGHGDEMLTRCWTEMLDAARAPSS